MRANQPDQHSLPGLLTQPLIDDDSQERRNLSAPSDLGGSPRRQISPFDGDVDSRQSKNSQLSTPSRAIPAEKSQNLRLSDYWNVPQLPNQNSECDDAGSEFSDGVRAWMVEATDEGDGAWELRHNVMITQEVYSVYPLIRGALYCFLCGALWCTMYLPMKPWMRRMALVGKTVHSSDYLFSVCLGIYASSIAWLLAMSAWKKVRRERLKKSVLRPALLAGCLWAAGCVLQLAAMQLLPYAVAYCTSAGGSLLVSLLWGMLVFGEANTSYNRKCIGASFVFVFAGMVLLGLSAR